MPKFLINLAIIAGVVYAMVKLTPLLLQFIGDWLVVRDEPEDADAIVVLSGEKGERVKHAAKLFKLRYAGKIILTGGPGQSGYPEANLMKTHAMSLGMDESAIITECRASSTYQNALYVKKIADDAGFKKIILVTSPYHSRRALMHFERRFGNDVKILSCPAVESRFNPVMWWKRQTDIELLSLEYISFVWHILRRLRGG